MVSGWGTVLEKEGGVLLLNDRGECVDLGLLLGGGVKSFVLFVDVLDRDGLITQLGGGDVEECGVAFEPLVV